MLGYKKGNTKLLTGQIPLHYPADRTYLDGDPTKTVQDKVARKADLTNLDLTGATNTTGSTISSGTYFYLNGTLVRAKTAIASGATFTLNTNYEVVTAGDALDDVTEQINNIIRYVTYDIPNDATAHNYSYPSGFSINNCTLVGARCATRYGSIVDYTYSDFVYWGDFTMRESYFLFQPKTAGNSTRITFLFTEIHT